MSSTAFAYSQVFSRRFACFRVVSFGIYAGKPDFCDGFDSRQLHQKSSSSKGIFTCRVGRRGHILGQIPNKIVHLVGHVIKVIREQVPVLIERHSRRFMT